MNIVPLVGSILRQVLPKIPGPIGGILGQVLPNLDIFQSSASNKTPNSPSQMRLNRDKEPVKAGGGAAPAPAKGGFLANLAGKLTQAFPQAAPFVNAFKGIFGG